MHQLSKLIRLSFFSNSNYLIGTNWQDCKILSIYNRNNEINKNKRMYMSTIVRIMEKSFPREDPQAYHF